MILVILDLVIFDVKNIFQLIKISSARILTVKFLIWPREACKICYKLEEKEFLFFIYNGMTAVQTIWLTIKNMKIIEFF